MKKVFLCSPDKGIERERAVAMCELEALESTGGIEALGYESFLKGPIESGAIQTCLNQAATADEVIILLGLRVGSPCVVKHPAKRRLKRRLKKARPWAWQWLKESKRLEPPVTWVEAEIIKHRIRTRSNTLPFYVFHHPTLDDFLTAYKAGVWIATGKDEFRAMIDGLGNSFETVKNSNSAGSGGSKELEPAVSSRIVWLAEFYWWLQELNAPKEVLTSGAIKDVLRSRFPGLSRAARGGAFWVKAEKELEVLQEFLPLLKGKVWAWDNSVNYLTEEMRFRSAYNPETLSRYTEIKLSVRKERWERLTGDAEQKQVITNHIRSLSEEHRSKIRVKLEGEEQYRKDIRPLTLLGVEGHCATGMLLVSHYWNHETPGIGSSHCYTNFVMGRGASEDWVHVLHDKLKGYFSETAFVPIEKLLTEQVES